MTEPAIEAMAAVLYADKSSPWVPKWDEISDGSQRYWIEKVRSVLTPLLDGGYVVLTDPKADEALQTAWEIYAQGGNGEGWSLADCFTALAIGVGAPVTEAARDRMAQINPTLAGMAVLASAESPKEPR